MLAYSHNNFTGSGTGLSIDIGPAVFPGYPPVMIVSLSGGTFDVQGSHDNANWATFLTGSSTAVAKDLIPGIRYWRTVGHTATALTSAVGPTPGPHGMIIQPSNVGVSSVGATP